MVNLTKSKNKPTEQEDSAYRLSKLRQSAEYKKYLRDHAEILRTYDSDVRGVKGRGHRSTSPASEW